MKKYKIFFVLAGLLAMLSSCSNQTNKEDSSTQPARQPVVIVPDTIINITLNDSIKELLTTRGRLITVAAKIRLKQELYKAVKKGGIDNAISFCNKKAMELTDSISLANKVYVRRLAKKNRNPLNAMTDQESNIYKGYIISHLDKARMQPMITWNGKGQPVYYNPMLVEMECMKCHGAPGKDIPDEIAKRIAKLYPGDKAENFRVGDLRGMWSVTFPEYRVVDVK